jgi:hypothetical protein
MKDRASTIFAAVVIFAVVMLAMWTIGDMP